jgi:predicted Zn-dependent peptidase
MPHVRSVGLSLLLPAGTIAEPPGLGGLATVVAEWLTRGAGNREGEELVAALDALGTSHSESAQITHTTIAASTLAKTLDPSLEILADLVLRPHLDEGDLEPIRDLCLQGLRSLEDDPASKALVELRKRHFPDPWGRNPQGSPDSLARLTTPHAHAFHQAAYKPQGAILALAGAIEWPAIARTIESLFADWSGSPPPAPPEQPAGPPRDQLLKETQQTQITLAFPVAHLKDPDYYATRALINILGGYSSSRFFVEVREKRGLCYSVYTTYESTPAHAALICHAGSAPDRAQQTLDVMLQEIERIGNAGVTTDELDMMRAGLKSSLIMQQESTLARAGVLAVDWFYLGRVRPLEEISNALDRLTTNDVSAAAARLAATPPTILTLGPKPLQLPE